MNHTETKVLSRSLEDFDVRVYTYKILEALEFSHSHGIMHRDVKPLNIVINHGDLLSATWSSFLMV